MDTNDRRRDWYGAVFSPEQIQEAERRLRASHLNLRVEMRGTARLSRAILHNADMGRAGERHEITLAEMPPSEYRATVISFEPLPGIDHAVISVVRPGGRTERLVGRLEASREGVRPEDARTARKQYFAVFRPDVLRSGMQ